MNENSEQIVLVTGASKGIGKAIAVELGQIGRIVYVNFQTDEKGALETCKLIEKNGGIAKALQFDVSNAKLSEQAVKSILETHGKVDILVNNHTYCVYETFDPELTTGKDWDVHLISVEAVQLVSADIIDAHFAINARAYALLMSQYVERYLKRKADKID